jgi:outer membrane protein OmpA-like peptidoglycan-associated protein
MKKISLLAFSVLLAACTPRQTPAPITNANDVVSSRPKIIDYSKLASADVLNQTRFYFGFNSTKLAANDLAILKAHAVYLKQRPGIRIILMGYSDPVGHVNYNQALAKRRAQAIANQLIADGVAKDRISIVSYGEMAKAGQSHASERRVDLIYGG